MFFWVHKGDIRAVGKCYHRRMHPVPAENRNLPGTLWGITSYFNFAGYATKKANYLLFRKRLREQGLPLIAAEAALPGVPFELTKDDAEILIQRRTSSVLWQKERLLNIAREYLPNDCDKVMWLDADILFADRHWLQTTAELLHTHAVVQPFSRVHRLAKGVPMPPHPDAPHATEEIYDGAIHLGLDPAYKGRLAGAPGFAMAFRREILDKCHLYDTMILGGSDGIMTSAFLGLPLQSISYVAYLSDALRDDAVRWMKCAQHCVRGSATCAPGTLYALWHGNRSDRRYFERQWLLESFDPSTDIRLNPDGCWEWASPKPALHRHVREYFLVRKEDGDEGPQTDAHQFDGEALRAATRVHLATLRAKLPAKPSKTFSRTATIAARILRRITRGHVVGRRSTVADDHLLFSTDWFTAKSDRWHEHLGPLKGKIGMQYLEVGSWEGRSVCWMLTHVLTHATARATCIDLFPSVPTGRFRELAEAGKFPLDLNIEERFDHNIRVLRAGHKVRKIRGDSHIALAGLRGEQFDCIYIDGDHHAPNVLADALLSWPLLRKGGLLIFDDYRSSIGGDPGMNPRRGIDAFLEKSGARLSVLHKGKQVFVRKESTVLFLNAIVR